STVHTSTEIVLTVGSFDTLLDVSQKAKEHGLAAAFCSAWCPMLRVSLEESSRVASGWGKKATSVSEAWVRDLFQHRGFRAWSAKRRGAEVLGDARAPAPLVLRMRH
ncbi:MAG: hypothetical protein AAFX94_08265, partial [Myxococcota bacterium]